MSRRPVCPSPSLLPALSPRARDSPVVRCFSWALPWDVRQEGPGNQRKLVPPVVEVPEREAGVEEGRPCSWAGLGTSMGQLPSLQCVSQ